MMNVSEYASDVGLTVEEILKLCKNLEIKVSKEDDMLSDDDIIMLDNEIANNSTESEEENEDEILEEETLDDIIEEELGKKILPGIKKFTNEKIRFVTYLYEGFRGENSTVLKDYINKYNQRELNELEKDNLYNLLEANRNSRFYNDVFASLQILMNQIIKENYPKDHLLYTIIGSLPKYIILEPKLVQFFTTQYEYYYEDKLFTVDSLISIFDYFESLCWKDMKKIYQ